MFFLQALFCSDYTKPELSLLLVFPLLAKTFSYYRY